MTVSPVQTALDRSLAGARERGWTFRQGDQGAAPPAAEPWQAPPPWPPNLNQGIYNNMAANPEAATRWFGATEGERQAQMALDPARQVSAAYARDPAAAARFFGATEEERRRLIGI